MSEMLTFISRLIRIANNTQMTIVLQWNCASNITTNSTQLRKKQGRILTNRHIDMTCSIKI